MKKNINAPAQSDANKLSARDVINHIISKSCIYFTAIALVLLIAQALSVEGDEIAFVDPTRFFMLYPFTLCIAIAELIFKAKTVKTVWKLLVHYGVLVLSFYIFVCSPVKTETNPVAIVALVSLLYFAAAGTVLIIRAAKAKKEQKQVPYESVYKNVYKK